MNDIITALETSLEYAREALARHDAELGRNHEHTRLQAMRMQEDIADIQRAIERLKANKLNPPETAPRKGTVFLGDFGYPWLVATRFNPFSLNWNICAVSNQLQDSGVVDMTFDVEWRDFEDLKGWLPIPRKESK